MIQLEKKRGFLLDVVVGEGATIVEFEFQL